MDTTAMPQAAHTASADGARESGHGFGYGPELLDEFTRVKVVYLGAPPPVSEALRSADAPTEGGEP